MNKHYLNSNGLKNGKIPAGKPCPFLDSCSSRNEDCPSDDNLKEKDFPCPAARAHSIISISDNKILRKIYHKEDK